MIFSLETSRPNSSLVSLMIAVFGVSPDKTWPPVVAYFSPFSLDVSNENIIYIGDLLFGIPFGEIYYLKKDLDIAKLKLQQEEVEQVEYLTKAEILKLIETEKMVKSHGLMFKKMLDKTNIK